MAARLAWTRTQIAAAMRVWRKRTGSWPTFADWTPSQAARRGRSDAVELFAEGGFPLVGRGGIRGSQCRNRDLAGATVR